MIRKHILMIKIIILMMLINFFICFYYQIRKCDNNTVFVSPRSPLPCLDICLDTISSPYKHRIHLISLLMCRL